MAETDKYYEDLFAPLMAKEGISGAAAAVTPGKAKLWARIKKEMSGGKGKGAAAGLLAWLALDKVISAGEGMAERGIQKEAIRGQAALATPENLYYQAAMPRAQAEEEQARVALFSTLSGGVLGPSNLAKGERMIGGG